MSSPTKDQAKAINIYGKNTIVSAGAGSGKTFVLKTRVKEKLLSNEEGYKASVNELIILTFTNNAAAEMKDRIRKVISETPELKDQLDLVESAYITTFDSFTQSLVKKYNYKLGIDKNFTIIDSSIVNLKTKKILDEIFNEYYENPTDEFRALLNDFDNKSDDTIKNAIITMYSTLINILDRQEYLDTYIEKYFSETKVKELIQEYRKYTLDKAAELITYYNELIELIDPEKIKEIESLRNRIGTIQDAKTIKDLSLAFEFKKPNSRCTDDKEAWDLINKNKCTKLETSIKNMLEKSDEQLEKEYTYTKSNINIIISILKKLDSKIMEFKKEKNSYEFNDIALLAIDLLDKNKEIANEIKYSTKEIMIDEYQDTNDIQDKLISYISNDNVYMVGDVKQSIYKFRNANPYIFKDKYDKYDNEENETPNTIGYKVEMKDNFRSRSEVINNINDVFSIIMLDDIGGANYVKEHKMNAGNKAYNDNKLKDFNYNMEIYNYKNDDKLYTNDEIEAFIIAHDIKEKMNSNLYVMDGDNNFNKLEYKDFCILIDKSKNFELLKKVLEYYDIPTTLYKDVSIKEDDEVYILKNLITLLTHIELNNLDEDFNHAYISIARSYIYKMDDNEIFKIFNEKTVNKSELFNKLLNISKNINGLSNKEIIIKLINEFNIFEKLITVGNVKERSMKLEYFINNADALNKFGLDIFSLENYFNEIINSDEDIKMSGKNDSINAVKIMTIHGSKGLEFPFVYMPYMGSRFKSSKETRYPLSKKYGIILDYNEENVLSSTFIKELYDYNELKENVSEKIRLFYVAATRAREQFIIINSWNENIEPQDRLSSLDLIKCKSYKDILSSAQIFRNYTKDIDLSKINMTSDYKSTKSTNYKEKIEKTNEVITVTPIEIDYKRQETKHFSKELKTTMTKEMKDVLDKGTLLHYCFEIYNFQKDNLNELHINEEYKDYIRNFLKHPEVKNISKAKTYKEHDIRITEDGITKNGIIDLLVEYDDHFDIIDYKTDNIDSEEYVLQLNGYKNFIENTYNKTTNIYLYSIKKDIFKKI